jgi:hypothetical protein
MPSSNFSPPSPPPRIDPAEQLARAADIAGAVRLTDVRPTAIRWLWPDRIPLGRITLLVSDPGLGKSLLALDIAARVSSGTPWPDSQPSSLNSQPSTVLLLTAEDNLADTVRPRLEALGADCSRILAMSNWGSLPEAPRPKSQRDHAAPDVPRRFAFNRDLARLANLLKAIPDCRLIVIDPITEFLGGTNEQSNADVRNLLGALSTLAREHDIAILIISHLRKKEGAAIYRTMGSLAFVAAARAAWILAKDPAEPNKRLLLPLKNNLAPDVTGLAFTLEPSSEPRTPVIRWSSDAVNVTIEALPSSPVRPRGRPDEERQFAIKWLQEHLAESPLPTHTVKQDAEAFGISYSTLRRAFRSLDGEAIRCGWPTKTWHWKLPGTRVQKYEGEFWTSNYFDKMIAELAEPWMGRYTPRATDQSPPSSSPATDSPISGDDRSACAAVHPTPACHAPP